VRLFVIGKNATIMFNRQTIIQISEGGLVKEFIAAIQFLKKEQGTEIMYTSDGQRIHMDDVISVNGVRFN
jgi:hypothetical protein